MSMLALLLLAASVAQAVGPGPDHAKNPVFAAIVRDGIELGGTSVRLPAPLLKDGLDADAQHAALLQVAGSEGVLADLLRDSVTAPFILKVHDVKANDGTVRLVDLWFVVRGNLEEIDPMGIAARTSGRK